MHDRMVFDTFTLRNGLVVHAKPWDVPFTDIRIRVPVGHVHNTARIIPGTAHLLEHMLCRRCKMYPGFQSFDKHFGLRGAHSNASTDAHETDFYIEIASEGSGEALRALVSRTFEPFFDEQGLAQERSVISNERNRQSKWYPGDDELEHYLRTEWFSDSYVTLRQQFGSDEDLAASTADSLLALHKHYFRKGALVLIGGTYDLDETLKILEQLETFTSAELPEEWSQVKWVRKDHHEREFYDVTNFVLYLGGIVESRDLQTIAGMIFLGKYLVNSTHGPLHRWLRHERAMAYGVHFSACNGIALHRHSTWVLRVPLNTRDQANEVRREIFGKIEQAFADQAAIETELTRLKLERVFRIQTLDDALGLAQNMLSTAGNIFSEREELDVMERIRDPGFRRHILQECFNASVGTFTALPTR